MNYDAQIVIVYHTVTSVTIVPIVVMVSVILSDTCTSHFHFVHLKNIVGIDELICSSRDSSRCGPDKYYCVSNDLCISLALKCNGVADCDREDEMECGNNLR